MSVEKKTTASPSPVPASPQADARKTSAPGGTVSPQTATVTSSAVAPATGKLEKVARALMMYQRKEVKVDPQQLQHMSAEIQAEAQQELSAEPEVLLGILGVCMIPGHDVHFLNAELNIDHHVKISEQLEERLEEARRTLLAKRSQIAAVFVFSKSFKYLTLNGVLKDE